jgi:hypothetical protein
MRHVWWIRKLRRSIVRNFGLVSIERAKNWVNFCLEGDGIIHRFSLQEHDLINSIVSYKLFSSWNHPQEARYISLLLILKDIDFCVLKFWKCIECIFRKLWLYVFIYLLWNWYAIGFLWYHYICFGPLIW